MKNTGSVKEVPNPFDYSDYELQCRDNAYNRSLLAEYLPYFQGCRRVLDIACGAGLFLELLAEHGIPALGVERNPTVVNLVRKQGHAVVEADVITFLAETVENYDGVFCSHFIEHLPFEQIVKLIELSASRLEEGGTFVLVFPNPESIRMQLFGFWRDPEHVRFYHPELIEAICKHYGLIIEFSNRHTFPFALPGYAGKASTEQGASNHQESISQVKRAGVHHVLRVLYRQLLSLFRLVSKAELVALEQRLRREKEEEMRELMGWSEKTIGAINRIWAWPDNAMIVCRKPPVA